MMESCLRNAIWSFQNLMPGEKANVSLQSKGRNTEWPMEWIKGNEEEFPSCIVLLSSAVPFNPLLWMSVCTSLIANCMNLSSR